MPHRLTTLSLFRRNMAKGKATGASKKEAGQKKGKAKSAKPKGKSPPYLGRTPTDPYLTLGKVLKSFLTDKRLVDQKVTIVIDAQMTPMFTFSFKEQSAPGALTRTSYDMGRDEYLAHRADRAVDKKVTSQAAAWQAFKSKITTRTLLSMASLPDPEVQGRTAQTAVLEVLSPQEKDLFHLSQANWDPMVKDRWEAFLAPTKKVLETNKVGDDTLADRRKKHLLQRFEGRDTTVDLPDWATFWREVGILHTTTKAVVQAIHPVNALEGRQTTQE